VDRTARENPVSFSRGPGRRRTAMGAASAIFSTARMKFTVSTGSEQNTKYNMTAGIKDIIFSHLSLM
jgi:hypothetical protein